MNIESYVMAVFKTDLEYKIDEQEIQLDASFGQNELSGLINQMLDLNYELDFIIGGSILKTSLKEHLEINNISPERTIEIEYILQNPKPEPEKQQKVDDWVIYLNETQYGLMNGQINKKPLRNMMTKCFEADDTYLVASYFDQQIEVYNRKNLQKQQTYKVDSPGESLSIYGDQFCVGQSNGTLSIGKFKQEDLVSEFKIHQQSISVCEWYLQDSIITGSYDHSICQFNVQKQKSVQQLFAKDSVITDIQTDSNQVLSSHEDGYLKLWDFRMALPQKLYKSSQSTVSCIRMKEKQVLAGGMDGILKIWDLRSDQPLYQIKSSDNSKILAVCWCGNGTIKFGGSDSQVHTYKYI